MFKVGDRAKKPEHDIRVGDVVIHEAFTTTAKSWAKECLHAQTDAVGIVASINDDMVMINHDTDNYQQANISRYILIHRPTAKG